MQFAVGKLPNRLPHSRAARARWNFRRSAACTQRDLKLDIEHSVQHWLHFQLTRVPHALLPTILPNWKIKRATIRFLWHMAHSPCPSAASRHPGRSRIPIPRSSGSASSSAITTDRRWPTSTSRTSRDAGIAANLCAIAEIVATFEAEPNRHIGPIMTPEPDKVWCQCGELIEGEPEDPALRKPCPPVRL